MVSVIYEARQKYGENVHVTIFPHGLIVPWKQLSISDYLFYTAQLGQGTLSVFLEDEIFCKCVFDKTLVRQIDYLAAGIVSVVAQNVIQFSGPTGLDAFNDGLEQARQELLVGPNAAMHDLVSMITNAFPYKPEEVYAMDYDTFLLRIIQAEKKLLAANVIKEPVKLIPKEARKKKTSVDALRVKEMFEQRTARQKPQPVQSEKSLEDLTGTGKWWNKSPILEAPTAARKHIDFKTESAEQDLLVSSGWEKVDRAILQKEMVASAQKIYAGVLGELAKKKQR